MLLRFLIFWPRAFARLYNSVESIALGLRERQNNTLKEKQTMRLKVRYLKEEPKIIIIKKTHTHTKFWLVRLQFVFLPYSRVKLFHILR